MGDEEDSSNLLALAGSGLAVGAVAGLVGSAFNLSLEAAERFRGSVLDWAHQYPGAGWLAPVLLAAGTAFVARWLVRRYAPEASGSGVQRVEEILRGEAGRLNPAALPIKFVGGVLALGAGLALGREGPTVQMSAAIGEGWARLFQVASGGPSSTACGGRRRRVGGSIQCATRGRHLRLRGTAASLRIARCRCHAICGQRRLGDHAHADWRSTCLLGIAHRDRPVSRILSVPRVRCGPWRPRRGLQPDGRRRPGSRRPNAADHA